MAAMAQEQERHVTATRPASGIVIDPAQLTRMRDLYPMSREDLAERTGEILFDRDRFARMLAGHVLPDARTVRALWTALGCDPDAILRGLPSGITSGALPRWLRQNDGWSLDLAVVDILMRKRGWTRPELATAVARHWFSRDSVNKIERGERRPKPRTLRAFCQILGCTPLQLMPGSRVLPDGRTRARRELLDYNAGMRAFADAQDPPLSYRKNGRISYSPELRKAYAEYLISQDDSALAS